MEEDACTFDRGAVDQRVYACLSCSPADSPAGFCVGCALHCHLEHEVIELWTRRGFRCDCGTPRLRVGACEFDKGGARSAAPNEGNRYDHNFRGRFCHCDGGYDEAHDAMVQCAACEDWFHDRCLSLSPLIGVASSASSGPFVCRICAMRPTWAAVCSYARADQGAERATQRRRVEGDAGAGVGAAGACVRPRLSEEAREAVRGFDVFLPPRPAEWLCACTECRALYASGGAEFLLRGEEEEEEEEEEGEDEEEDDAVAEAIKASVATASHEEKDDASGGGSSGSGDENKQARGAAAASAAAKPLAAPLRDEFNPAVLAARALRAADPARVALGLRASEAFQDEVRSRLRAWAAAHPGVVVTGHAMRDIVGAALADLRRRRAMPAPE